MEKEGFFSAKHGLLMHNSETGKDDAIKTKEEMLELIRKDRAEILNNEKLQEIFKKIDDKIYANQQLRDFRAYLNNHREILPELSNMSLLKKKIWKNRAIKDGGDTYRLFRKIYNESKKELEDIYNETNKEKSLWYEIVEEFNDRFDVPFSLSVSELRSVIMNKKILSVNFVFNDRDDEEGAKIEKAGLLKILSNGEKRALALLDVLFEMKIRENEGRRTFMILDDVVESFDYKNKYTILQYLAELSQNDEVRQIVLTHNFDFFRTAKMRYSIRDENCYIAQRDSGRIEIKPIDDEIINMVKGEPTKYIREVLIREAKGSNESTFDNFDTIAIVAMLFLRNLLGYIDFDDIQDSNSSVKMDKNGIIKMIHVKKDSEEVNMADLYKLIFRRLKIRLAKNKEEEICKKFGEKRVQDRIFELADRMQDKMLSLNDKIILALASRLRMEKYITNKYPDAIDLVESKNPFNQTKELYDEYKKRSDADIDNLKVMSEILIATPQSIHVNGFIYEPLLDASGDEIKRLYERASKILV